MYFWTFKELNYQRPRNGTSIAFVLNLRHGNATQAASLFGLASVSASLGGRLILTCLSPEETLQCESVSISGFSVNYSTTLCFMIYTQLVERMC